MSGKKENPESKYHRNPELRIYGVPIPVHDALNNIADNTGISLTDFMKPHLREIVEKYPEKMRKPKPKD